MVQRITTQQLVTMFCCIPNILNIKVTIKKKLKKRKKEVNCHFINGKLHLIAKRMVCELETLYGMEVGSCDTEGPYGR